MGLLTNSKSYLTAHAYALWEKAAVEEPLEATKQKIIKQLFFYLKQHSSWANWYYSFVEFCYPKWLKRKVDLALSAYKFDLTLAGKQDLRMHLFSAKEKWFFDQKLTGIFKNILSKKNSRMTIGQKGKRWDNKIRKYHQHNDLMIGNYILHCVGQRFPNYKTPINWLKAVSKRSIEYHCKKTFINMKDSEITHGLMRYLENPSDSKSSLSRVFSKIIFYVAQEKVKGFCHKTYSTVTNQARSIGEGLCDRARRASSYAKSYLPL